MCGIAGFNWKDENKIKAMNEALSHRGPDDCGVYIDKEISLGHRRLSIIDLSSAGHQPMSESRIEELFITYNGEIYNFSLLREELSKSGYSFNSNTDTEVILNAYKEWGEGCLSRFIGMFSFAIYDKTKDRIFVARDHIGIKPFYYYISAEKFIFASEINAILLHNIQTKPNKKLIRDFLLYNVTDHTHETFFTNICKLPKGYYGIYDLKENSFSTTKWYDIKKYSDSTLSYNNAKKKLKELLKISVDRRLLSDVPVGTCLSGGIDSSTIACLIKKIEQSEMCTFSAIYPGFKLDESKYISIVNEAVGMKNITTKPTADDIHEDLFDFVRFMGEPVPALGPYTQFKVFQLTKNTPVKVLLDGQGADELFAGYEYFIAFYLKGLLKRCKILTFLKELSGLIKGKNYKKGLLSFFFLFTPARFKQYYFRQNCIISESLYSDKHSETSFFKDYFEISCLKDSLVFHLNHKLEQLLKWEDRNSMAFSREARVPFLDIELINFVVSLPEKYIISDGVTKSLLRDSMGGIVPSAILGRRDKIGFATPEDEWLRSESMQKLLEGWFVKNEPLSKEYIDMDKLNTNIKKHLSQKKDIGRGIWKALLLEAWFKNYNKYFLEK